MEGETEGLPATRTAGSGGSALVRELSRHGSAEGLLLREQMGFSFADQDVCRVDELLAPLYQHLRRVPDLLRPPLYFSRQYWAANRWARTLAVRSIRHRGLHYLEDKGGYRLFAGERRKCSSLRPSGRNGAQRLPLADGRFARPNRRVRPSELTAAMATNGGINRIHHVDHETTNILGIYAKYVTIVYGE